jgi:hypothetical protein
MPLTAAPANRAADSPTNQPSMTEAQDVDGGEIAGTEMGVNSNSLVTARTQTLLSPRTQRGNVQRRSSKSCRACSCMSS